MKEVTIKLYSFNELQKDAQQFAMSHHRNFLMHVEDVEDEEYEYTDSEITENIEANDYLYFRNGKLTNCITYTGSHEKSGITEFTLNGEIFNI